MHIYAARTMKDNISKRNKFCLVNEIPKVRFAIWHFLWIMKCNLSEKCQTKSHFETGINVSEKEFHDQSCQVIIRETYNVFFECFGQLYRISHGHLVGCSRNRL